MQLIGKNTRSKDNKLKWIFQQNMFVNMLQPLLCVVDAAIFLYFGKASL